MALVRLDAYVIPALDGVVYGLLLFVVAAGLVLCFGVADILNLAHGTLYAVGAYTAAALWDGGWPALLAGLAVAPAVAGAAGAAVAGLLAPVARRDRCAMSVPHHPTHLAQALLTFGVALAGGSLLVAAFGPDDLPVRVPAALAGTVEVAGHRYSAYRLVFLLAGVAVALLLHAVIARTRAGMLVRAAADDAEMVAALGFSTARVRFGVLACAGALAGLGGALGAPIIGPGPGAAATVLLLSLVVVVLGGTGSAGTAGSVGRTLVAALAVGEIQSLGVALAPGAAPFLLFGAMAVVLAARSLANSAGPLRTWRPARAWLRT